MRAIKIDTFNKTVSEIEIPTYDDNSDAQYKAMRAVIGAPLCIGWYHNKDVCFVDDEGLLKGPTHFFYTPFYPTPLAGNGIIVGESRSGNTVACKMPLNLITDQIRFYTHLQVLAIGDFGLFDTDVLLNRGQITITLDDLKKISITKIRHPEYVDMAETIVKAFVRAFLNAGSPKELTFQSQQAMQWVIEEEKRAAL